MLRVFLILIISEEASTLFLVNTSMSSEEKLMSFMFLTWRGVTINMSNSEM